MTDLKITQQQLENQQILLTIVVPDQRVDKAMRAAAKKLAKQYRIPGFRPGKAPYHVVVSRFGREAMLEEVADEMGQEIFKEALEAAELDPYAQATLKDITFDPLTYQVEVPLPPEIDPNNYRELSIPYTEPSEEAIAEAVQKEIDETRERFKTWQPVERPVEYGDLVTISLKVTVDGKVVLENDDWDFVPDAEDYTMAPEFDAAFIGMTIDEAKNFSATFPDDSDSPWEGEEGHFEVKVIGVKSEELPELDDELAQETDYETFEEMREDIFDRVQSQLQFEAQREHRDAVLNAMIEEATLSYPPATLENEIDGLIDEQASYFRTYGIDSIEEYLRMMGKTLEEYREELRPTAKTRLERRLVLDAIADREQFEISDYELDQYLVNMLGHDPEQLALAQEQVAENGNYRAFIITLIQREHAEDLVANIAKGEEMPEPGQHPIMEAPPKPEETPDEETEAEESASDIKEDEIESADSADSAELPEPSESGESEESEISQPETEAEDTPEA
jgi:trigger factor